MSSDVPLETVQSAFADSRYQIERPIGHGGMAWVFLAQDVRHRRRVAVKVLRPELGSLLGVDRFLREIEIAAGLGHPHILPLYDSGEAGEYLYYVMPFVEGQSLRTRLDREKQLPVDDAVKITAEVADALAYAHAAGVVHRDIKPENVLLVAGHAVVTDFGIARAVTAAAGDRLTGTGIALGTPAYMSPEQSAADAELDGRSDIYSLGCVLYEMLAGAPPFTGPNPQAIMARRMTDPILPIRTIREGVPEHVEQAVFTALSRAPADRFATASHLASAIAPATTSRALTPAPAPSPKRRLPILSGLRLTTDSRLRLTAIAALAVLLFVAGFVAIRRLAAPDSAASSSRLAVLPFAVRGDGSVDYLAEGLVDLLSRNLDGDEIRTVDPATVFTATGDAARNGGLDTRQGRAIASRVGARRFVLGSVNAVGGQLRIHAAVYDRQAAADDAVLQASVEGDTAELFRLVDRLSAKLLVGPGRGTPRLAQSAAITTHSLPALKAFLEGERRLRTASLQAVKLDSAIAAFRSAVEADTTFALAYYRMAVAAGWANRHALSTASARRAAALATRLTERDRRLLEAYVDFRRGAAARAEQQYQAIVADWPDDLEAAFQLADVRYNYNPLHGRPRGEAREPFNQVLEYDPGFL